MGRKAVLTLTALSGLGLAQELSGADTAWMLVSTALVLLMTPALAFFYGGLVRSKNALNTMLMSFAALAFVGVGWALLGYTLAFGEGGPWLGGLGHALLQGVGLEAKGTIPHLLFLAFQGTFAIITAALVSGAIVERMRFPAYLAFLTLWGLLVYAPLAHWVWGGGFLGSWGPWTSPGARWSTSTPGWRGWWGPWSSGPGRTTAARPSCPTAFPSPS
jgi:Amt family ammonium transporter